MRGDRICTSCQPEQKDGQPTEHGSEWRCLCVCHSHAAVASGPQDPVGRDNGAIQRAGRADGGYSSSGRDCFTTFHCVLGTCFAMTKPWPGPYGSERPGLSPSTASATLAGTPWRRACRVRQWSGAVPCRPSQTRARCPGTGGQSGLFRVVTTASCISLQYTLLTTSLMNAAAPPGVKPVR